VTLNGHYILCIKIHAILEPSNKIWIKIDPGYQRQRCSSVTLVSDKTDIREAFPKEGVSNEWVVENGNFHYFSLYFFRSFRYESNQIKSNQIKSNLLKTNGPFGQHFTQQFSSLTPFHWLQNMWPLMTLNDHFTLHSVFLLSSCSRFTYLLIRTAPWLPEVCVIKSS